MGNKRGQGRRATPNQRILYCDTAERLQQGKLAFMALKRALAEFKAKAIELATKQPEGDGKA